MNRIKFNIIEGNKGIFNGFFKGEMLGVSQKIIKKIPMEYETTESFNVGDYIKFGDSETRIVKKSYNVYIHNYTYTCEDVWEEIKNK